MRVSLRAGSVLLGVARGVRRRLSTVTRWPRTALARRRRPDARPAEPGRGGHGRRGRLGGSPGAPASGYGHRRARRRPRPGAWRCAGPAGPAGEIAGLVPAQAVDRPPPVLRIAGVELAGVAGGSPEPARIAGSQQRLLTPWFDAAAAAPVLPYQAPGADAGGRRARALAGLFGQGWLLWRAPVALVRRIMLVTLGWLGLCAAALCWLPPRWADVVAFAAFTGLGSGAVILSGRLDADLAVARAPRRDPLATWVVAVAVLLPALYPTVIGLPLCWLAGRTDPVRPPHLRVFHAARLGIAGFCASSVHVLASGSSGPFGVRDLVGTGRASAALLAAVAVYTAIAALPGIGMSRAGRGEARQAAGPDLGRAAGPDLGRAAGHGVGHLAGHLAGQGAGHLAGHGVDATRAGRCVRAHRDRHEALPARIAELCSSVIVAVLWAASPLLLLAVPPPMLALQRSLVHTDLLHAARSDAKTRLANPAYWRQVAERELGRVGRSRRPMSVLLVDIDHFKRVNDRFGHLVGDIILLAVADTLRGMTRPRDLVGRFGGEEFVVLLSEVGGEHALDVAEQIRRQVARTRCRLDGHPPLSVTVSVGVATHTHHGPPSDLATLLARADNALYSAKADGRNRVAFAEPLFTSA
ncbi:GGDEF domain-containing protein [Frankia sp. AgKG'84/4]